MTRVFVNRENELAALVNLVAEVSSGRSGVVLLEGSAGVGKTALLEEFSRLHPRAPRNKNGSVAVVRCHAQVGGENAYGPFLDALQLLRPTSKVWRRLRLGSRIAMNAAPDALEVIPALGPALKIGAAAIRNSRAEVSDGSAQLNRVPHVITSAITEVARQRGPIVIAVDDAHRIDASSCLVASYLVSAMREHQVGLVLAYRGEEVDESHPLHDTLIADLGVSDMTRHVQLGGFGTSALGEYVRSKTGADLRGDQERVLLDLTGGHPIFAAQYLSLLRERGVLRPTPLGAGDAGEVWAAIVDEPVPKSVELVIQQRLRKVDDAAISLLVTAATQGERFLTAVVEKAARIPRNDVLTRLDEVSRQFGLIQVVPANSWAASIGSDVYAFEHALLRNVLYARQSPQARRDRHADVGAALEELAAENPGAPQDVMLDIARHHQLGGRHVPAARSALALAAALAREGGSLAEAEVLCRQALDAVKSAESTTVTDRLIVEVVELLLLVTEPRWSGTNEFLDLLPLESLVEEAEAAARRTGDIRLRIRAAALRGRVLHKIRGVAEALEAQEHAVHLAEASGDPILRFLTVSEYGRELTKRDLGRGLEVLREAERIADEAPDIRRHASPILRHALRRTELQVAVSLLDSGNLGEAAERLAASVARLRGTDDAMTMPIALNYLAQAQVAIGAWAEASQTLCEAAAVPEAPSGWHAYNIALLGLLEIDTGNRQAGLRKMGEAWAEIQQAWLVNIGTLVQNLYAEALLRTADGRPDVLVRARELLVANVDQCERSGMIRSEVVARSLLGRLLAACGDVAAGLDASGRAVTLVERHGRMPAVRIEEIYYGHAVLLTEVGDRAAADGYLALARRELAEKANSIGDARARIRFHTAIPLNAAIMRGLDDRAE